MQRAVTKIKFFDPLIGILSLLRGIRLINCILFLARQVQGLNYIARIGCKAKII